MTPEELKKKALDWLGIKSAEVPTPDVTAAEIVAPAVVALITRLPIVVDSGWTPAVRLGATMLTARLIRRRNSPAGIEAFTADGAAYVARTDPDVATMLRLGPQAAPQVG